MEKTALFDDHIRKILKVRGIDPNCIIDFDELRQVYLRAYTETQEATESVDAAYVDAAEAVVAYL